MMQDKQDHIFLENTKHVLEENLQKLGETQERYDLYPEVDDTEITCN